MVYTLFDNTSFFYLEIGGKIIFDMLQRELILEHILGRNIDFCGIIINSAMQYILKLQDIEFLYESELYISCFWDKE